MVCHPRTSLCARWRVVFLRRLLGAIAACVAGSRRQERVRRPANSTAILRRAGAQLTGRSRVIVEFHGTPDVRAITSARGVAAPAARGAAGAGRPRSTTPTCATLAADPRVARVMVDRPAFATLERTARGHRLQTPCALTELRHAWTGAAASAIAVIDSGVNAAHDDLWRVARPDQRVVHFKDFTTPSAPSVWTTSRRPTASATARTSPASSPATATTPTARARGIAPGAHLIGAEGARRRRARLHQRRHRRDRLRDRQQDRATTSASSTCRWRSGVFESYDTDPLTQAAKRAVDAGIVVVGVGGQPRPERRSTKRSTAASRRRATRPGC